MIDYNTLDLEMVKFQIGKPVSIEGKSLEDLMDTYERLIVGCYLLNKPYEDNSIRANTGFAKLLDWLRTTDFYTCPASTKYHESYAGGLLVHTLRVYDCAMALLEAPQFRGVESASAALAALTHDWCKIGLYEVYMKNVKNEDTGKWEKVPAYRYNQRGIPLGHGVASMFLASKFFRLSPEVALAIRWHMSTWRVCDAEVNELQLANENYPLVHLIQFADQLAITEYGKAACSLETKPVEEDNIERLPF